MERVFEIVADATHVGVRVDKFLAGQVHGQLSRIGIQTLLKRGAICCNGKPDILPRYRVKNGDRFTWVIKDVQETVLLVSQRPLKIVYEDDFIVVVDKPEGMVVHPGNGVEPGTTLVEALLSHCPLSPAAGKERPGVVHRIDQATSGLVLLAKVDQVYWQLTRMFAERRIQKVYYALVKGIPTLKAGVIEAPIGRATRDRTSMCVCSGGRYALTYWSVQEVYVKPHRSLLICEPKTGRTHQLRVHLKSIGHGIVGDTKYGNWEGNRMFLHAYQLSFYHPVTHKWLMVCSDLPTSFVNELNRLRAI